MFTPPFLHRIQTSISFLSQSRKLVTRNILRLQEAAAEAVGTAEAVGIAESVEATEAAEAVREAVG
jgi:hypothetical protein